MCRVEDSREKFLKRPKERDTEATGIIKKKIEELFQGGGETTRDFGGLKREITCAVRESCSSMERLQCKRGIRGVVLQQMKSHMKNSQENLVDGKGDHEWNIQHRSQREKILRKHCRSAKISKE